MKLKGENMRIEAYTGDKNKMSAMTFPEIYKKDN